MKLKPKNTTLNQRALVYRRYNQIVDSETTNYVYKTSDNRYWSFIGSTQTFNEINAEDVPIGSTIENVDARLYQLYQFKQFYFKYIEYKTQEIDYREWKKFTITQNTEYSFVDVISGKPNTAGITTYQPVFLGLKKGTWTFTFTNNSNETMDYGIIYGIGRSTYMGYPTNAGETRSMTRTFSEDTVLVGFKADRNDGTPFVLTSFDVSVQGGETFDCRDMLSVKYPQIANTIHSIAKYQKNAYYYAGSFPFMLRGSVSGSTSQYIKGNIVPLTSMNIKYFDDSVDLQVDDLVVVDGKLYSVENPETDFKFQPKGYKIHFATLNNIL